jgi:hypothetical protein
MSRSEQQHIDEEQALRCRRLLLAVVDQAVRDACLTPLRTQPQQEALSAMRFLFDTEVAGLAEYAPWLDFDPNVFRSNLQEKMRDSAPYQAGGFAPTERRAFRFNYTYWQRNRHDPNLFKKDAKEKDDGHPKIIYTKFVGAIGKKARSNNESAPSQEGEPVRSKPAKSPRKQSSVSKKLKE